MHKRRCVFFDRDGIVNVPPEDGGYVCCPEDFMVMPEFLESLRIVEEAGYDAVIITNQQGVGKGLYSEQILKQIHAKLNDAVESSGLNLLAIYHCPHLAEDECVCRKPRPGMLRQAAEDWDIDLAGSWMIGDSVRDIEAGLAAGCRTIYVGRRGCPIATHSIPGMAELPSLVQTLLSA